MDYTSIIHPVIAAVILIVIMVMTLYSPAKSFKLKAHLLEFFQVEVEVDNRPTKSKPKPKPKRKKGTK